jgi:hypothetical protein
LWEQIKERRLADLKKVITRTDKGISYELGGGYVMLANADILLETSMRRFAPRDVLLPAKYALQKEINRRLSDAHTLLRPTTRVDPGQSSANHIQAEQSPCRKCGYSLPKRSQKNFSSKSVKDAEGISRLVRVQGVRMLRRAAMPSAEKPSLM